MSKKVYMLNSDIERPSKTPGTKIGFGSVSFSRTQVRVLEKIGEGFSNTQIAEDLELSRRTIESHVFNIKIILADHFGYKFCDRELVLFSRQMLDDYKDYIKENIDKFTQDFLEKQLQEGFYDQELTYLMEKHNLGRNILDLEQVSPSLDTWTPARNGQ